MTTEYSVSMHPIKSAAIKVGRAHEHLVRLENEVAGALAAHKNNIVRSIDPESGRYVFRIYTDPEHEGISATLGDVVHNLRAAMNSIAYGFKPSEMTEFPMFSERTRTFTKKLETIFPPEAHEAVERFQPYQAGDAFEQDPLWVVHRLNIVDKHRALVPVVFSTSFQDVSPKEAVPSSYERHTEVWTGSNPNLEPKTLVRVPLSAELPAELVPIATVGEAYDLIRMQMLPAFECFFTNDGHLRS